MLIPELARIVMPLNGSSTLRTASHAFSFGVIGFTCGPFKKRAYQLMKGTSGGHGTCCTGWASPAAVGLAAPEAPQAAVAAISGMAPPTRLTWQGPAAGIVAAAFAGTTALDWAGGASGNSSPVLVPAAHAGFPCA